MAKKYILELEVDDKGAVQGINRVEKELKDLNKEADKIGSKKDGSGLGFLEKVSPRAAGAVNNVKGSITGLAGGFKTLRTAIISTGIGALIVALGSLVAYFTKTKRGAELLERATAALGAAMSVLIDRAAALGEKLVFAFKDPKQAIKDLGDFLVQNLQNRLDGIVGQVNAINKAFMGLINLDFDKVTEGAKDFASATQEIVTGIKTEDVVEFFKDVGEEIANDVKETDKLTKAMQRLRDMERGLQVETAKRRADIKEFNKIAEDTTKTYAERERAAQQAAAIEEELLAKRLRAAEESVRIIAAQNALSESTEEDLQRLADAEVELANVRMESAELQTTIQNKLNTIRQQQRAEELAAEKKLAEERKKIADEVAKVQEFLDSKRIQSEEEQIEAKYERLREQANGEIELLKELEFQKNGELLALQRDRIKQETDNERDKAKENEDIAKNEAEQKLSFARTTADGLMAIAELVAGNSESAARKIFAVNKALGISNAVVDTFRGASKVLADWPTPGPARFIAMAATITTGLANVAKIAATKFNSGSSGGGGGGSRPSLGGGSITASAPQPTSPVDFSFLNGQQQPIPAYVMGSDIKTDQEARTRVNDLATL